MGVPDQTTPSMASSTSTSHLYPQALQLKLYQAFIFSIPILFSIILFLLFYLFYLKRRASSLSSSPPILPRSHNINHAAAATTYVSSACPVGLKGEIKEKLHIVLFDEELRKKDSQCCVCLGEFEMEEELLQVLSCKHVFHIDCIHHWLHNNTTCPLCRCSVIPITKLENNSPVQSEPGVPPQNHSIIISHHSPGIVLEQPHQQQQLDINAVSDNTTTPIEGSSSASATILRDSSAGRFSGYCSNQDLEGSVTIHIQMHDS